ncbi:hypothetical protein G7046_g2718 [Stylonectria norvegica]|nr:hypothetical protein G7046_g2718 [Stylonectria norvegica]
MKSTMLFTPLALAASAAALIIVPEISEADEDIFKALPIDLDSLGMPATALAQSIEVPCAQCRGRDSHLKMDFAIEDETRLTLNGFELYPNADPWHGDLTASVIKGNGNERERRLGYSLAVKPEGRDEQQDLEVVGVHLRVIEVGDRFVEGVAPINVQLVKAPHGAIIIGSINVEAKVPSEQCSTLACRVNEFFGDVFKGGKTGRKGHCGGMRGGRKGQHGHNKAEEAKDLANKEKEKADMEIGQDNEGEVKHPGKTHKHHSSKSHKHHSSKHHSWCKTMKSIVAYVFLPVLMGITAGVSVALLAMFLCSLVVRATRFFKSESGEEALGASQKATESMATYEEEKSGLMLDQDELPQYEDDRSSK